MDGGKKAFDKLLDCVNRTFRRSAPEPHAVQPITAPPALGLSAEIARLGSLIGTGPAAPKSVSGWRTGAAQSTAAHGGHQAANPGSFYDTPGGSHAGGHGFETGFGGSRVGSAYGSSRGQPEAKRPRVELPPRADEFVRQQQGRGGEAAAGRQPHPRGVSAPSALTNPELRVKPGAVDTVVVESDEGWIGSKQVRHVMVKFHQNTVSLFATFPDGSNLRFTLDVEADTELRWGFNVLMMDASTWPPGWKHLFVLRTPTTTHLPFLQMASYYSPADIYDPQESTLCCMLLDKDARPDAAALRRQLLAIAPWRPLFRAVSDAEHDDLTVNRKMISASVAEAAPQQTQQPQRYAGRETQQAPRPGWGARPPPPPPKPALPKLPAPLMWPPDDPDSLTVTNADLRRLVPGEFLNDTLVDFCIKQARLDLPRDQLQRFHFFNSFFFTKLTQEPDADELAAVTGGDSGLTPAQLAGYERVRRWSSRVDVFAKDFVLIPVNKDLHWTLAILCHPGMAPNALRDAEAPIELGGDGDDDAPAAAPASKPSPCILHLNSLGSSHATVEPVLRAWLACEWAARKGRPLAEGVKLFGAGGAVKCIRCKVPQQPNTYDCGLFVAEYAHRFCLAAPQPHLSVETRHGWPYMFTRAWFKPEVAGTRKREAIQRSILTIAGVLPPDDVVDLT